MLFACLTAPTDGGATGWPTRRPCSTRCPPIWSQRFEREGWLLTRNYNDEIGASCRRGVRHRRPWRRRELLPRQRDRVRVAARRWPAHPAAPQRRGAHPVTGRRCWFNQIAFLNEWTMDPEVHEYLVDIYGADGLPFNTALRQRRPDR